MLDFFEKRFNQMPFFVKVFVILSLFLAILARLNHRLGLLFSDISQEIRRIIRTVSNHTLKVIAIYQIFSLSDVMPRTTSHDEVSTEQRAAMGIPERLIRYSVGIEAAEDLIADLDQALEGV